MLEAADPKRVKVDVNLLVSDTTERKMDNTQFKDTNAIPSKSTRPTELDTVLSQQPTYLGCHMTENINHPLNVRNPSRSTCIEACSEYMYSLFLVSAFVLSFCFYSTIPRLLYYNFSGALGHSGRRGTITSLGPARWGPLAEVCSDTVVGEVL